MLHTMYDDTGVVLGASVSGVILPATTSALTGINFFVLLLGYCAFLFLLNVLVRFVPKHIHRKV